MSPLRSNFPTFKRIGGKRFEIVGMTQTKLDAKQMASSYRNRYGSARVVKIRWSEVDRFGRRRKPMHFGVYVRKKEGFIPLYKRKKKRRKK